jgi:hypothetical protein
VLVVVELAAGGSLAVVVSDVDEVLERLRAVVGLVVLVVLVGAVVVLAGRVVVLFGVVVAVDRGTVVVVEGVGLLVLTLGRTLGTVVVVVWVWLELVGGLRLAGSRCCRYMNPTKRTTSRAVERRTGNFGCSGVRRAPRISAGSILTTGSRWSTRWTR